MTICSTYGHTYEATSGRLRNDSQSMNSSASLIVLICCILNWPSTLSSSSEFYDLSAIDIDGNPYRFSQLEGKVVIIVNVASECGFTQSHYTDLKRLRDILGDTGKLEIIGFPCNQFGAQEPGRDSDIKAYVQQNYHIDFPLMSKVDVFGQTAHPVWKYLTEKSSVTPKWNFYKFIVNHEGIVTKVFPPQSEVEWMFDYVRDAIKVAEEADQSNDPEGQREEL